MFIVEGERERDDTSGRTTDYITGEESANIAKVAKVQWRRCTLSRRSPTLRFLRPSEAEERGIDRLGGVGERKRVCMGSSYPHIQGVCIPMGVGPFPSFGFHFAAHEQKSSSPSTTDC
jgi:hypothetical protein